jgi:hypothetical protein
MELIDRLYTNLNSPASFAGVNRLFDEAHRQDPSITREQVQDYVERQRTYTLHKPGRVRFARLRTVPKGYFTDFQVDLADFQKLVKFNNKHKYLLVGVEVLSRQVYAVPVLTKKGADMKRAFDQLFSQLPALPWSIMSDRGVEFDSREMKDYFAAKDIAKHSATNVETKASMAERMIRTLKNRLYRYFTEKRTLKWVDAVPKIAHAINNSVNRSTGMRPYDINFQNAESVWERLYGDAYAHKAPPPKGRLEKGDVARVGRSRDAFRKGYLPTFSNLTYAISTVKGTRPTTYTLEDPETGRDFAKKYYREELSRTTREKAMRIEKVLRRRNAKDGSREFLVKWEGEPVEAASWLSEGDVAKLSKK